MERPEKHRVVSRLAASPLLRMQPVNPFDPGAHLPRRLPLHVWVIASLVFVASYTFMWSYVHVLADTRPCELRLNDPLFPFLPFSNRWYLVSRHIYTWLTVLATALLFLRAATGDHRPIVRWGAALSVQALLRSICILLLPLCRFTVEPGTTALRKVPTLDLGFVEIPWRVWATNDLVFSGHVGEFLLLYFATRQFPKAWKLTLIVFQLLQVPALLATRGHYTIDIVLAVPCAVFADIVAVRALALLSGNAQYRALRSRAAR